MYSSSSSYESSSSSSLISSMIVSSWGVFEGLCGRIMAEGATSIHDLTFVLIFLAIFHLKQKIWSKKEGNLNLTGIDAYWANDFKWLMALFPPSSGKKERWETGIWWSISIILFLGKLRDKTCVCENLCSNGRNETCI